MRRVWFFLQFSSLLLLGVVFVLGLSGCTGAKGLESIDEWDLVMLGDNALMGVADTYGSYIEQDIGVTVRVHDLAIPRLDAQQILKSLRGEVVYFMEMENLPKIISDAEVVVLMPNWSASISPTNPGDWNCTSPPRYSVPDCELDSFDQYSADLTAVINEIFSLRGNSPIIIHLMDYYGAGYGSWQEQGVAQDCSLCLENLSQVINLVANNNNIPVAKVYDSFNGANHDEDPFEKGYVKMDLVHTTEAGSNIIAGLLRDLGYEPVLP